MPYRSHVCYAFGPPHEGAMPGGGGGHRLFETL